MRMPEDESFTRSNFEISTAMKNKFTNYASHPLSRYRNALVGLAKNGNVLPKLITVVLEDDLLNKINKNFDETIIYAKAVKWIMNEFNKVIKSLIDLLPAKAKTEEYPYVLWLHATRHRLYPDDKLREIFNAVLASVGKQHSNNFTLELKQLWKRDEDHLFNQQENKLTAYGIKTYWKSVDRTIKFCNSIVDRVTAKRTMNRINNVQPGGPNGNRSGARRDYQEGRYRSYHRDNTNFNRY